MATPSWNLTNQDCNAFDGGWSNNTDGGSLSTTTEDGRSVYKFDSTGANHAYAVHTSLSSFTEGTFEAVFKKGTNNIFGRWGYFDLYVRDSSRYSYKIGCYHLDESTYPYGLCMCGDTMLRQWVDIKADNSSDDWHTARIVINSSHEAWFWFDNQFICKLAHSGSVATDYTNNTMGVAASGGQDPNEQAIWFVDHLRASSTKAVADNHGLIKIEGSGGINCRVASLGSGGSGMPIDPVNPADPIRLKLAERYQSDIVYGLPLVSTGADHPSVVRVNDGSIKAIQRIPESGDLT